jgi:hypothetical protein
MRKHGCMSWSLVERTPTPADPISIRKIWLQSWYASWSASRRPRRQLVCRVRDGSAINHSGHGYEPVVAAVCNAAAEGVNFSRPSVGNCVPLRTSWHMFLAQTW